MKTFKKILFSIFVFTGSTAMACHQGDFTTPNKSHHKWGKNSGLFQYTEGMTISTSTTTSCDFYTAYIENQYDIIQEQVAKGHGSHLDALAHFTGCREQALRPFRRTLNTHYEELFGMQKNPAMVREKIAGLIELTPALRTLCARG